ncbi:MAG: PQQ-dependent dehydrogenase, methanol/ethanol family, partial [Gammaproteobacteria bacterium]|nr:PQQ-dependent dehydrogenase, methanol/ethanol family [Gammaproteobacteria bacterium]
MFPVESVCWRIAVVCSALFLWSCGGPEPDNNIVAPTVDKKATTQKIAAATKIDAQVLSAPAAGSWPTHGLSYKEQRHSPLDSINSDNVAQLGLAWYYDLDTNRGIEATPLIIDGVLYTTASWSKVYALDARSGALLWSYDPQVPKIKGAHACCDVVNRGVAVWGDSVFVGTLDGRLIALDRSNGQPRWSVATFDPELTYTITGAPRVVKGNVIIGNGGAEYGVRGYVSAYDAVTGELAWRFYTVPGNPAEGFESEAMRAAAATWTGEWWQLGGGGTVWDSMAYDPQLDLLYIGVGNGSPWNHKIRSPQGGDNLYLSSIVALNPDTGDYVWHYQTTPGDSWDYTATQHMILADLDINGELRQVIMQAPKNGFFYVLDRATGEFLSAQNYVPVNWAEGIDPETGRPLETPGARFEKMPHQQMPAPYGGHNWHPMAFNPATGLVYIPAMDIPFVYANDPDFRYRKGTWNTGIDTVIGSLPDDRAIREAIKPLAKGALIAWDPVTQQEVWRFDHIGAWNGGVLSTAGNLVFQGNAAAQFAAYDAQSGAPLWSADAQTGIVAAPVTYALDGEQYVAVMAGWGGSFALVHGHFVKPETTANHNRVLVYKLGGTAELPATRWQAKVMPQPPPLKIATEEIQQGKKLYHSTCQFCHGDGAVAGGLIPDLRYSPMLASEVAWHSVVFDGSLAARGMSSFAHLFDETEIELMRRYV